MLIKNKMLTAVLAFGTLYPAVSAIAAPAPKAHQVVGMRRLTEEEYRNSIADIFGLSIKVTGSFEPATRIGGLLAASTAILSVTPSGFASYTEIANNIAGQVVSEKNKAALLKCSPRSATEPDESCAREVLAHYGPLLYRRSLTKGELEAKVSLAGKLAKSSKNFYTGLQYALASMLVSPDFLFRVEAAVPTATKGYTLDGDSRATQLSYFLWNTTPDAELLRAGASGELSTPDGLSKQVDRMIASPRLETGVRAFFTDMLELTGASSLPGADFDTKDAFIYPQWNVQIANSAKDEAMRTIVDLTLTRNGDVRDLMTTNKTFVNRPLASVYGIPYNFSAEWTPYEFPAAAGRSGLLTQISMLRSSHPGRSSPTERGVMVMDIFLCEPTPTPPANVDFSIVNNTDGPLKTVRERLSAHATNAACASCHTHSDPIGLTLERFDSTGSYHDKENGAEIDVSGTLNGKKFTGAAGLGAVMHDDPKFPACVARKMYAYGVGANAYDDVDPASYKAAYSTFVKSGYRIRPLLKAIATSDEFFSVVPPVPDTPTQGIKTASNSK